MRHQNVLQTSVFVKVLVAVLTFLLTVCLLVSFAACGGEEKPESTGGKKRPAQYTEGYTTQHDGFTGTVHWIKNDESGFEIYGRMFKPDDFDESKKYATAIVCHGFNALSEDGSSRIVQNYIAQGMLCYTFDFCGGGNSVQSEGETTDMSVETEITDLEYVVDYVQSLPYVDTDKLVLTGKSFGGLVVATEAARNPEEFAGLVLFFPAVTIYESFHEQYPTRADVDALPDVVKPDYFAYGKQYYIDMFELGNPLDYINDYDKQVIILQGNADESVNIELQRKTVEAYNADGKNDCEFVEVDGAPHNFSDANYLYVMPFINEYLQRVGVV